MEEIYEQVEAIIKLIATIMMKMVRITMIAINTKTKEIMAILITK